MDVDTRKAFVAHVRKLERLAIECEDDDRRLDAVLSLAAMALLKQDGGGDDPPGAEVVGFSSYLRLAA